MRACVFRAPGQPLEIVAVPDPVAGPGELVVRVRDCGICSSDLHAAQSGLALTEGTIMGHELSGTVEAIGPGVSGFERGTPVALLSYQACGACESCRTGAEARCSAAQMVGFGALGGGYAELMKIRAASVFRIPPGVSFRAAATVEPLAVALHGIRRASLAPGEGCIVMGAGPIGLLTVLWARFAGVRAVVVSEPNEVRRQAALKVGADAAVVPRFQNPGAALARLTGAPPDAIFECVGGPGSLAEAMTYARRGGRIVVLGAAMQDDGIQPALAMSKELDVRFSLGCERGEIETALAMLAAGRISTEPMITHTLGLDDLPRAFAALPHAIDQIKVMIELT